MRKIYNHLLQIINAMIIIHFLPVIMS